VLDRTSALPWVAVAALLAAQGCMPIVGDGNYQVGPQAALAGCTDTATSSTCPAGQACVGGLCESGCVTDSDCPSLWFCVANTDPSDAGPPSVCMPHCDPVSPSRPDSSHVACPAQVTCQVLVPPGTAGFTDCLEVNDTGGQGQTCGDYTSCAPGYACVATTATANACLHYCRGPSDCAAGLACQAFSPSYIDGADPIGFCQ
jgi:hypothetical protein